MYSYNNKNKTKISQIHIKKIFSIHHDKFHTRNVIQHRPVQVDQIIGQIIHGHRQLIAMLIQIIQHHLIKVPFMRQALHHSHHNQLIHRISR